MQSIEDLSIPKSVLEAKTQAEILRVWIADGDQVVTLSPRMWEDPGAWGLMLVDIAKHVAAAYEAKGITSDIALQKIRAAMQAEWSNPTN